MAVVLNQDLTGNERRDVRQGHCARKKTMMAAEWGKQLLPLFFFYPTAGNL
jgi:hypothetical protein